MVSSTIREFEKRTKRHVRKQQQFKDGRQVSLSPNKLRTDNDSFKMSAKQKEYPLSKSANAALYRHAAQNKHSRTRKLERHTSKENGGRNNHEDGFNRSMEGEDLLQ